jgi:serine O-acetyltransferase
MTKRDPFKYFQSSPEIIRLAVMMYIRFLQQVVGPNTRVDAAFLDPPYNVRINGHANAKGRHREFAMASGEMSEQILREIADEAYATDPDLGQAARADLVAVYDRDPACHRFLQPILYFKGYQAVQAYRVGHWLWQAGRIDLAYFVQMRVSEVFGVDIHPAAKIGRGIMIDHAHSIVIGETAVVGDNVSMLHSVTLGGTGKEDGVRHPKIGNGVLIGAGAKVLGNIEIGYCSRIAAGSVVLQDVPPCSTVAGVPARVVGEAGCAQPSVTMDHLIREHFGE